MRFRSFLAFLSLVFTAFFCVIAFHAHSDDFVVPKIITQSASKTQSAGKAVRGPASVQRAFMVHSHNDYQQPRPLSDALDNRFDSVEGDIWLSGGKVLISHMGFKFKGSLVDLYLEPLRKLVEARGSVYGDGKPFTLWLDVKQSNPELMNETHRLLSQYHFLTEYTEAGAVIERPVTVILTGDEANKAYYVEKFPHRFATRDSNEFRITDPDGDSKWSWYSIEWSSLYKWGGHGSMPEGERQSLVALVNWIHDHGRKVRFWDTPDSEEFWNVAIQANVDAIGTDHLQSMSHYLQLVPNFITPIRTAPRTTQF